MMLQNCCFKFYLLTCIVDILCLGLLTGDKLQVKFYVHPLVSVDISMTFHATKDLLCLNKNKISLPTSLSYVCIYTHSMYVCIPFFKYLAARSVICCPSRYFCSCLVVFISLLISVLQCLKMTTKRNLLVRLVPCRCLRGEEETVTTLDYSHCSLEQVPKEIFTFEKTLEELYLDANQIEELPKVCCMIFLCATFSISLTTSSVTEADSVKLPSTALRLHFPKYFQVNVGSRTSCLDRLSCVFQLDQFPVLP